jgi:hypothetical protein
MRRPVDSFDDLSAAELLSDARGVLRLPTGDIRAGSWSGKIWLPAKQSAMEIAESGTFWMYDRVTIEVAVCIRPEGMPGIDEATVKAVAPTDIEDPAPWSQSWLQSRGVGPHPLEGRIVPGAEGRFTVEVPRLPRWTLLAHARGWRPASATVAVPPGVDSVQADLVLTPGLRIEGRVTDGRGKPLAGAVLDAMVVRRFPWDRSKPVTTAMGREFSPNGGVSMGTTRDGMLEVRISERCITDAEGRYVLFTKSEGEVGIYVFDAGRKGVRIDLGSIHGDLTGIDFEVPEANAAQRIAVQLQGLPLANRELGVLDLTDPKGPSLVFPLDERSEIPADWLVEGRWYHVMLVGDRGLVNRGFVHWDGRGTLDLSNLSKEVPSHL